MRYAGHPGAPRNRGQMPVKEMIVISNENDFEEAHIMDMLRYKPGDSKVQQKFAQYFKDETKYKEKVNMVGHHYVYTFPNGFIVSIIDGRHVHSYPFYSELMVIKQGEIHTDDHDFEDVTVVGTEEEEFNFLERVYNLP